MTIHSKRKTPPVLTGPELRAALLRIAQAISAPESPDEETADALVEEWARLCPHPGGTDILFWPNELGLCRDEEVGAFTMSPEEMVAYALAWEPRIVAMRIKHRLGGPRVGYYLYELEAPHTPKTQVAAPLDHAYAKDAIVAVALKGVQLADGSTVAESFEFGPASCGKILGFTDQEIGARVTP